MKANIVLAAFLSGVLSWTFMVSRAEPTVPNLYRPAPAPAPEESAYFKSLSQEEKDIALRSRKRMEKVKEKVRTWL